jgi:exodeoxyribonuclease VII small subunit
MDPTIKDFEAAISELETIVRTLEEGDLPLERSLELYERGVQLSRFCHARLEEAERRIEILDDRGELKNAPPGLAGTGAAAPDDEPRRAGAGGERDEKGRVR